MARNRRTPELRTAPVAGGLAVLVPDRDRPRAWTLTVDGAPQSHVDLDDPAHLEFSYQRRLGHVIDLAAPPGKPVNALHLGGGALTLARYLAHTRPRSAQQVAEADAALTDLVRAELPWDRTWRIKVRGADAREALARMPAAWADLVIADVFSGARTPAHLTTAEFLAEVRRVLVPGGWYAANLTDGGPLSFLRGQIVTVRAAFGDTALVAEPAVLRGKRFGNAVLCATDGALPLAELTRRAATDPAAARVEHGRGLAAFAAGAPVVTDATAVRSPQPPPDTFG
jgi:spermidine synthase